MGADMKTAEKVKHTPAPWKVGKRMPMGITTIHTWEGGYIADLLTPYSAEEREANARLIACAPELLEIVKALHGWFEENPNGYNGNGPSGCSLLLHDGQTLGAHIRAAISKAETTL